MKVLWQRTIKKFSNQTPYDIGIMINSMAGRNISFYQNFPHPEASEFLDQDVALILYEQETVIDPISDLNLNKRTTYINIVTVFIIGIILGMLFMLGIK